MDEIEVGTKVRFTANQLGVMSHDNPYRFDPDRTVGIGDEGTYLSRHPRVDDWHLIAVDFDGETYECPVDPAHFEVVAP